jgi:hypothetical protein
MADPPVKDITGGICDWCFENIRSAKHALSAKNSLINDCHVTSSGHGITPYGHMSKEGLDP